MYPVYPPRDWPQRAKDKDEGGRPKPQARNRGDLAVETDSITVSTKANDEFLDTAEDIHSAQGAPTAEPVCTPSVCESQL